MHRFLNHAITVRDVLWVGVPGLIVAGLAIAIYVVLSRTNWDR